MNFRLYGNKPFEYVVVHGGPGVPGSVSSLARKLAKSYNVIEPFQTELSVWDQVEELYNQITINTQSKVYILGHSWGAWLVYLLAFKHPDIIQKAFLIGSGVFDSKYLSELTQRRINAFSEKEKKEYFSIIELLKQPSDNNSFYLSRLGELAEKADNYCIENIEENKEDMISINGTQYQQVWNEAAKMREDGFFVSISKNINCPICIIHGENDTSPIEGVVNPLKDNINDFKWYKIEKCGHSPWKEKYGRDIFFKIIENEH